jgi:hypothetical protein
MTHKLSSVCTQRVDVPANSWTTAIFIPTGIQGTITNITIDVYTGAVDGAPALGTAGRNILMTATADNAPVPQIGGIAQGSYRALELQKFFGPGLESSRTFRTSKLGVTENNAQAFSGYWRRPIPFGDGFRIDLYCPGAVGAKVRTWILIEYIPEVSALRLHADLMVNTVAPLGVATLLDILGSVRLLGVYQRFIPQASVLDYWYLEGDHRIYYDGELVPSYRSNGTEDFFGSSDYFIEGLFASTRVGCHVKNMSNGQISAYRFFDEEVPESASALLFTWTSGDPSPVPPPPYSVVSDSTLFYYQ